MLLRFSLYNAVPHPIWVNTDSVIWVEETSHLGTRVAFIQTSMGSVIVLDPSRDVATKINADKK